MPRIQKVTERNLRAAERQRQAWALFRSGATATEVAQHLGISRMHATRLRRKELDAMAAEKSEDVEAYRLEEDDRLMMAIREHSRVAMAICRTCRGVGSLGREPDLQECDDCAGTGRRYSVAYRMTALENIRRCSDQRAKLWALYEPAKINVNILNVNRGFDEEVAQMPVEELDRELAMLLDRPLTRDELPIIESVPYEVRELEDGRNGSS